MIPLPPSARVLRSRAKFLALTFAPVLLLISIALFAPRHKTLRSAVRANDGAPPSNAASPANPIREENSVTPSPPSNPKPKFEPGETNGTPSAAKSSLSVSELAERLRDVRLSVGTRERAAYELAHEGSLEALRVLKEILGAGPLPLRAAIAEALGDCPLPEAHSLLAGLLDSPEDSLVLGAIRGLAAEGTAAAADLLSRLLNDAGKASATRSEAAFALAGMNQPGVVDTLTRAALTLQDEDVVPEVLRGLGSRSIEETKEFFQSYLASNNVSSELKVAALEGLGQAKGDATAFLINYAADSDPEIRSAAALALSITETQGTAGDRLLELLAAEKDPGVRARFYQALGNQEKSDLAAVMREFATETDRRARIAGLDFLAGNIRAHPTENWMNYFEKYAVRELKQDALTGATRAERSAAVVALKRANTPGAGVALQQIASQASDPRIAEAAAAAARARPPGSGPAK